MKLKLSVILFFVVFFSGYCETSSIASQSWVINFGNGKTEVAYYNSASDKSFTEGPAYGPLSFRVIKNKLWLLDSVGGKILVFSKQHKLLSSIKIPDVPKNVLLDDFAIVRDNNKVPQSIWVAEAAGATIRKISLTTGKEILRIGDGKGYTFTQIHQLEVDKDGRLYVGDYGKSKIAVFTPSGKLIREIPWQLSDFALDENGCLYNLHYSEEAGYFLQVYLSNGALSKNIHIGLADMKNAKIVSITPSGVMIAMFVPVGGFKGTLKLININEFGAIKGKSADITPTMPMNRFVSYDRGEIWNAIADYGNAPKHPLKIVEIDWN